MISKIASRSASSNCIMTTLLSTNSKKLVLNYPLREESILHAPREQHRGDRELKEMHVLGP